MVRPGGLGKGLGALIPSGDLTQSGGTADTVEGLQEIPLAAVVPNKHQPRTHFDEQALGALTESIRELGVLQPVIVRPNENGQYELIAGERRVRAARRAGLQTVPAVVRTTDDSTSLAHAIVENIQREDLNPLEEAQAYQQLVEEFGLTHDDVATRVGRSRTSVTNSLRLLHLPPAVQRHVREGRVRMGHARALLGSPDRAFQEKIAERIVRDDINVRTVEQLVRDHEQARTGGDAADAAATPATAPTTNAAARSGPALRPPGLLELEELLSDYLDTRVQVSMHQTRGRVLIEFATLEDLERIYRVMTEGSRPR